MTYRTRLFALLFLAGFTGILSFLLIDVSAIIRILPVTGGTAPPLSPWLIKLLSLIQPSVLLAAATLSGVLLASKVSLSSPAFEALARRQSFATALRPQIIPGLIGGLIGAVAVVLSWVLAKPTLPPEFAVRAAQFNRLLPIATRLLYGGVTEEILLRWGLLTFLVWVAWKLLQRGHGQPRDAYFVGAILLSSIVFGLGHLPIAFALGSHLTVPIVLYVVTVNSVFGLIAGYLYWRKGLEAAITAHMLTHIGIVAASHLA